MTQMTVILPKTESMKVSAPIASVIIRKVRDQPLTTEEDLLYVLSWNQNLKISISYTPFYYR